ncbi:hypothetical protein 2011_scaffold3_00008 [Bacteriophage sp.]|nr:hypothetical protein 2011_scaffold3_00008 [Bacteriophage sp.]
MGRCKKVLLFVRLCCCEFQRFNNFFCCHGLSLSFCCSIRESLL